MALMAPVSLGFETFASAILFFQKHSFDAAQALAKAGF